MRTARLQPRFGTHIPGEPEAVLYVSMEYATAVHLCACGCGSKVVTPLGPADWQLMFDGTVTLRPSIGNGRQQCRSHYYIRQDTVGWMRPMTTEPRARRGGETMPLSVRPRAMQRSGRCGGGAGQWPFRDSVWPAVAVPDDDARDGHFATA